MENDAFEDLSGSEPPAIAYRAVEPDDHEFLYQVYASTRNEEMAVARWSSVEIDRFLRSQFQAQHTFYLQQFKGADFQIILVDGVQAGRFYRHRRADEIRVIDIALLPEFRGRAIGTSIMRSVLAEADDLGLPVRIHVERNNPAMRLYLRLGFKQTSEHGIYWFLEHPPAAARSP